MLKRRKYRSRDPKGGFTLVEILLVSAIIAVMLAVIIPRALRANVDTKFNTVRQVGAEVAKWGMTWAERNLQTQHEDAACTLIDYVNTLNGVFTGDQSANSNWAGSVNPMTGAGCRGGTAAVSFTVQSISPEDHLRNPFNGASYFSSVNNGAVNPFAGQLRLASGAEGAFTVYYLLYIGTEATSSTDWYGNMSHNGTLDQLRAGVFMARLQ